MIALGMALALLFSPQTAWADCDLLDETEPTNDCDEDGVSVGDGDCDDESDQVSPELEEICSDNLDNNCDEQIDEGCEEFPDGVELSGGGQCGLVSLAHGTTISLAVLAVVIRRERPCF